MCRKLYKCFKHEHLQQLHAVLRVGGVACGCTPVEGAKEKRRSSFQVGNELSRVGMNDVVGTKSLIRFFSMVRTDVPELAAS